MKIKDLPEKIDLTVIKENTLDILYSMFSDAFHTRKIKYKGKPVIYDNRKNDGEKYEEGFWHIVSKGKGSDRLLDTLRAEKIAWCFCLIEDADSYGAVTFEYKHKNNDIRTYIWLKEQGYVVVLKKIRVGFLLTTAFHIEGESKKHGIYRKYDNREK